MTFANHFFWKDDGIIRGDKLLEEMFFRVGGIADFLDDEERRDEIVDVSL